MEDDEGDEEEGEDQGWWAASTSCHNAPWEASIVVAWPLALLWISNDNDDGDGFFGLSLVIVVAFR